MACSFSIPFQGSAEQIVSKARSAVQGQGGDFEGNSSSGSFGVSVMSNTIKGNYTVAGNELHVVIDSKPFFVPCSTIEGFLRNQLTG